MSRQHGRRLYEMEVNGSLQLSSKNARGKTSNCLVMTELPQPKAVVPGEEGTCHSRHSASTAAFQHTQDGTAYSGRERKFAYNYL